MDMVERVRAALIAEMEKGATNCVSDYRAEGGGDEIFVDGHIDGRALARAAIAAMREPTEGMEDAFCNTFRDPFFHGTDTEAYNRAYAAMIDAALTSSETQAPSSE